MHFTTNALLTLLPLALAAPTSTISVVATGVPSVGKAIVTNNCDFPVYLWSVDSTVDGPHSLASKGMVYSETMHYDNKTGGVSLKITTSQDGLTNGSPQLNFAYAINSSEKMVYYDLSDVFGDAFKGYNVQVTGGTSCPAISWPQGTPPAGSATKACDQSNDLHCSLC